MLSRIAVALALFALPSLASGQGAILQGGPWTPGHVPQYVGQGGQQAVVSDGGGAGGGAVGANASEIGVVARGTGAAPYAGQGTGPYGTNICDYDAPTNNAAGYHYLCISANAQGGPLIAVGAGGAATALPMSFIINGTAYPFPFTTGGPLGPGSSTIGHLAIWNNTAGTLLADLGLPQYDFLIGNASGIPTATALTGDCTYGASGLACVTAAPSLSVHSGTTYTVQTSDCGKLNQATNPSATVWTLPQATGSFARCAFQAQNLTSSSLTINPQTSLIGPPVDPPTGQLATVLVLAPGQTANIASDGTNYQAQIALVQDSSSLGQFVLSYGYGTQTIAVTITLSGTLTIGDVVGFDYSCASCTPALATQQFRHTMGISDSFQAAITDLMAQFRANAGVKTAIGADVANQAWQHPSGATNWVGFFNQSWPMITHSPVTAPFTSGGATESITIGGGGTTLENGSGYACGHSTLAAGRAPQVNDILCIPSLATGDSTTTTFNTYTFTPNYGSTSWRVADPTDATLAGRYDITPANGNNGGIINLTAGTQNFTGNVNIAGVATVNASLESLPSAPTGTILRTANANGTTTRHTIDTFGNTTGSETIYRQAAGTAASPTATQSGTFVGGVVGYGYGATGFDAAGAGGAMLFTATENHTDTAQGMKAKIFVTPNTTIASLAGLTVGEAGGISVGADVDTGRGTVNMRPQTFSALTSCSSTIEGTMAAVTDSNTVTWGATVAGSSTNHVLAYCDGTNWTVAGK